MKKSIIKGSKYKRFHRPFTKQHFNETYADDPAVVFVLSSLDPMGLENATYSGNRYIDKLGLGLLLKKDMRKAIDTSDWGKKAAPACSQFSRENPKHKNIYRSYVNFMLSLSLGYLVQFAIMCDYLNKHTSPDEIVSFVENPQNIVQSVIAE